ncbi:uncharacterized protein LOC111081605 [Drosophila obscura]|uniref:uncharacterized protein LOC111081605 n=1 Tax=Drosophila obscura TaxID=7282 RepID=UPI001BB22D9F|nr:uncharacterized protein LOC111081605 [Drosophila obscura]
MPERRHHHHDEGWERRERRERENNNYSEHCWESAENQPQTEATFSLGYRLQAIGLFLATLAVGWMLYTVVAEKVVVPPTVEEPGKIIRQLEGCAEGDRSWRDSDSAAAAAVATAEEKASRSYFCHQPIYIKESIQVIGNQVVGQEKALARLEQELSRDRKFRSVALLGPPGVGKTMTAAALIKTFPWPENVRTLSWNATGSGKDHVVEFRKLRKFMNQLSSCGMNLHVIDDLKADDIEIVPIYNKMILQREGSLDERMAMQTVLVVYIFNLESKHLEEQQNYLQRMSDSTASINFRSFGLEELKLCLESELKAMKYALKEECEAAVLKESMEKIDTFGCKSLRPLIEQLGNPLSLIDC